MAFPQIIFLASLSVSDLLFLILVNSFRIVSIAQERWLYGDTMCFLNPLFARYFYIKEDRGSFFGLRVEVLKLQPRIQEKVRSPSYYIIISTYDQS